MFIDIIGIDLFDRNVGIACAKIRFRCSWVSLVLIELIKMQVRWAKKLDSDAHGYHRY